MTKNDLNSLIGLAATIALIVLSLIFFPFMRDLAVTPFIFIRDSIMFVTETIFTSLGALFS